MYNFENQGSWKLLYRSEGQLQMGSYNKTTKNPLDLKQSKKYLNPLPRKPGAYERNSILLTLRRDSKPFICGKKKSNPKIVKS